MAEMIRPPRSKIRELREDRMIDRPMIGELAGYGFATDRRTTVAVGPGGVRTSRINQAIGSVSSLRDPGCSMEMPMRCSGGVMPGNRQESHERRLSVPRLIFNDLS